MKHHPYSALLGLFMLLAAGCKSSHPEAYNVYLMLSPELKTASIQVDIHAIRGSELDTWQNLSVGDYWKATGPFYKDPNKKVFEFKPGAATSQSLSASDPAFKGWIAESDMYLVILADLTGDADSAGVERRRLILPLDVMRWDPVPQSVTVEITPRGLRPSPEPLEPQH